jgi:hypothetical protein
MVPKFKWVAVTTAELSIPKATAQALDLDDDVDFRVLDTPLLPCL